MQPSDTESERESTGTVLVIHLPSEQLELMSGQLSQFGCKVLTASDGRQGLEAAITELPNLIIADVALPDMNVVEFCRRLRADRRLRAIPLLLASSLRKDSVPVREGLKAGADEYLRMPYNPMYLLAKTARLIEQGRAGESSREREGYFRLLIEHSADSITLLSDDGTRLYDSPSVERLTGYKPEELVGSNMFSLIHSDDLDRVVDAFKAGLPQDTVGSAVEYRRRHKDGSWRVLESVGQRYLDESGKTLVLVNTRDITERKRTEEELRRRDSQPAETQHMAHIASFEWESSSNHWTWSDELFRIFGLEPQSVEITDAVLSQHLSAADKSALMAVFEKAAANQEAFLCEHAVLRADGTTRIFQVQGQAVLDPSRNTVKLIGTSQDITELKRSEEALRRSQAQFLQSQKMEAVGQLAGGVAHDFNNLLTVITGYSDIAFEKLNQVDPLRHYLGEIRKASRRGASLTHQLLAFSRRQVLQLRVMDLNKTVTDLTNMLSRLIGENISLKTALAPTLGSVKADPGQVEQVILNLVVNARDAMPNGGKLTIETHDVWLDEDYVGTHIGASPGAYVMIAVTDTGCGIEEKDKPRIFEPFFTTKEIGKGTGLGLSTVYGIVKQSGGCIWVYSELNRGTTFKIYLPLVDQKPEDYHRGSEVRVVPRGTETILLVEDEELLRKLTREVLEMHGYHVLEASNGRVALALSEEYQAPIHLLLTDVIMPEISGRTLARELLKVRKDMRVLYMSGYTTDAMLHQGTIEEGMQLVQKPFTASTLAQMVREALETPKE